MSSLFYIVPSDRIMRRRRRQTMTSTRRDAYWLVIVHLLHNHYFVLFNDSLQTLVSVYENVSPSTSSRTEISSLTEVAEDGLCLPLSSATPRHWYTSCAITSAGWIISIKMNNENGYYDIFSDQTFGFDQTDQLRRWPTENHWMFAAEEITQETAAFGGNSGSAQILTRRWYWW